jgi:initiation factor 1A
MVKNTTGGNKSKGKARKLNDIRPNAYLRTASCEFELYAQVIKVLGNGMCHVLCANDGSTRLCHIRGKFRGRGKSDNIVKNGSWLLVGLREWENGRDETSKKLQNCDLLEVYTEIEKEKLKTTVKIDWTIFMSNDNKNSNLVADAVDSFVFSDQKEDEYREILKTNQESKIVTNKNIFAIPLVTQVIASSQAVDDDVINVDDI